MYHSFQLQSRNGEAEDDMFEGDSDEDVEDISTRLAASTLEAASTADEEDRGGSGNIVWSSADMTSTVTPSLSIVQVSACRLCSQSSLL